MTTERNVIDEALSALNKAQDSYERACRAEDDAMRNKTAVLNTLNEAQKKFDAAIDTIKNRAGRDSDWWHKKRHREMVETQP